MKAKTRTPKKKPARKPNPVPIGLLMTAQLLDCTISERDLQMAMDAIEAAHAKQQGDPGNDLVESGVARYLERCAAEGDYAATVAKAEAADPGNMLGDLMCAYSVPAMAVGLAMGYLMAGGRR